MANFNFCGKITLGKESEKFKPVMKQTFDSGWTMTTVKFNCLSDTNRVMCVAQGGKWGNDAKNSVKTFSKTVTDANGNVTKGTSIEIPWDKRFDTDQIAKVAGFKKFIVDTGNKKLRYQLQDLVSAFEKGNATDDKMEELGVYNLNDAKAALEKSWDKRKEFISEWDFVQYLIRVCKNDKMKEKKFDISGVYDVQYNPVNGKFYTNYRVNRVILAADDAKPSTEMKVDFFYGENAWNDDTYDETGKCFINGFISYYDSNKDVRKNGFMPFTVTVKEEDGRRLRGLKRKFDIEDGVKQIGLTLKVVDGAERKEITMDDLDEETREDIECGLLDFESVVKALGGNVYRDRVSEIRFEELTEKKNIPQDTTYTIEDMHPARKSVNNEVDDKVANDIKEIMADMDKELPFDLDDDL